MNNEDFLDPSFLITHLVKCFCPNDLNALSRSIDVLQSFNFNQCEFNTSVFRFRWISDLEKEGKFDEIKIVNKSIEKIVQTVNRPNALFLLLDQLRPKYTPINLDPEKPFKSESLPIDFLFVLQGLEGKNFKWNSQQQRFVSSQKLSPNLYACAQRVSNIGCMVKTILKFLDFQDSLIHQNAACAVREIYINHLNYISTIESSFPDITPNQLLTYLEAPSIDELRAACIICTTVVSMRAASIYNVLNHISHHGDKTISKIALKMRDNSFNGIEKMIRSWVSKGAVDDPFFEFFIQLKGEIPIYTNWWHDRYFIARAIVPSNLTDELVQKIFSAGKSLNFLRTNDNPVELKIDEKLPLNEYVDIASKEANEHILSLIMKNSLLEIALHDIHRFLLLQRGGFAKAFLDTDPAIVKPMTSALMSEFANRDVENIRFDDKEQPSGAFRYEAKTPLSSIFGPNELRAYKVVSSSLLRLKKCEYKLNISIFKLRSAKLLAFEMHAFVRLVGDYFNVHIIRKSYEKFYNSVFGKEISFDELLTMHTYHVNFIARGCWATNSGQYCRSNFYKILDIIDLLHNKFHNVKPDKKQNKTVDEIRKKFHNALIEFHANLLKHKVSGIELAPPLVRMFKNVF